MVFDAPNDTMVSDALDDPMVIDVLINMVVCDALNDPMIIDALIDIVVFNGNRHLCHALIFIDQNTANYYYYYCNFWLNLHKFGYSIHNINFVILEYA